jgi:hypothetical protein
LCFANAKHKRSRKPALSEAEGDLLFPHRPNQPRLALVSQGACKALVKLLFREDERIVRFEGIHANVGEVS